MRPARRTNGRVRTFSHHGTNLCHFVALDGGGFVTVSADDNAPPILGFSASDELPTPGDGNPLWALLKSNAPAAGSAKLLASSSTSSISSETGLDDVRVSPLVQSKWNQKYVSGKRVYNYYTPNAWYCGCVATALAQLMRYHCYPSNSVSASTFTCYTNGVSVSLTMKGGSYPWNTMPLVPTSSITDAQREAIGKICYDAGVSVRMQYASGESAAYPFAFEPLQEVFGFANAEVYVANDGMSDSDIRSGILANLDAGFPVMLGIDDGSSGHAILADGYGYADGTLYCHLNMGWSGSCDYWYVLPYVTAGGYSFSNVNAITYNVFPSQSGELVTGRVTSTDGKPLKGATVDATIVYRKRFRTYTIETNVTTSATGIYSVLAPDGVSSTVTLTATYQGASSASVTARTTASNSPTSVDFETGNYSFSGSSLSIGNSWGNDITIKLKPFNGIIIR